MKKIFSGLMICMMLLCISAVSFGADGTETTNSDEITLTSDFDATVDVVAVSNVTFENNVKFESSDYNKLFIATSPLSASNNYDTRDIKHVYDYSNCYDSYINTTTVADQTDGITPSNHVGKLMMINIFILKLEKLTERNAITIGKTSNDKQLLKFE